MPLKTSAKIMVTAPRTRNLSVGDIILLADAFKAADIPAPTELSFASRQAIGVEIEAPERRNVPESEDR